MAATVWKGHLTFGLVSIPVKLYRAARPEKVSFRQLHAATGARVRQALVTEPPELTRKPRLEKASGSASARLAPEPEPFIVPSPGEARGHRDWRTSPPPEPEPEPEPREISRAEIVKGYEYERDRYVTLTREELEAIAPQTTREMQIIEFVQLSEVDPVYYETSYYAAPDKGGERTYSLLFEALRRSDLVGVAQIAMHNREHVVIIRPGRTGIVVHTMFYESEIRRHEEYRADVSAVAPKELDLALLLVRNLAAPFEPSKYRDTYREKLDALIEAKMRDRETVQTAPAARPAPVLNIFEALQRSLQANGAPAPKPPASEGAKSPASSGSTGRRRSGRDKPVSST